MNEASNNPVQAIERALKVLESIAANGTSTINDLHTRLNINKPSLTRITSTLFSCGYLNRDEKTGAYSLSYKTYEIGTQSIRQMDYMNLIKSSLASLSAETGLIAQFSVEDKGELLCIESFNQSDYDFSIYSRCFMRSTLYATSAGKAILSTYPYTELTAKLDKIELKRLTDNTITDREALIKELTAIRQRGFAFDLGESEYGLCCIGAVVVNSSRRPIGAISISSYSLSKEDMEKHKDLLLSQTHRLSSLLGGVVI